MDYSPEACPPEFAEEYLAGRGLEFRVDYHYDIWSFGMLMYELFMSFDILSKFRCYLPNLTWDPTI